MIINNKKFRTIWPNDDKALIARNVSVIDQTKLPHVFEIVQINTLQQMIVAIKTMQVRGAPLIGASAAYGVALAMQENNSDEHLHAASDLLVCSRPTAVNLRWAVERMKKILQPVAAKHRLEIAWAEAANICDEDVLLNQAIGKHGLGLIQALYAKNTRRINILTHCNAGWLATVDCGTALAPIYAAHDAGLDVHVWVDETRPRNQGASLTAWELAQHGVAHTVISDNAGGYLMQQGQVDMVIVGADRVTSTGDVCNKIGTYMKALAAFDNHVPFYAAVPSPTIDWVMQNGIQEIEIEERDGREVSWIKGMLENGEIAEVNILPANSPVLNPAFDVTPARLVTGIISELGVFVPNQLKNAMR
jgi:methylthioribose-1-phosphate isomerase